MAVFKEFGKLVMEHAGRRIVYKVTPAGAAYHEDAHPKVVELLEKARLAGHKVRVFYGDSNTGRDWLEENDVEGRIGLSMGPVKIPLMIAPRQIGGPGILESCVVRIQVRGKDAWRHPRYHQPAFESKPSKYADRPHGVFADGQNIANFKTPRAREKYLGFIQGESRSAALSA
jgi:hypothetical protein